MRTVSPPPPIIPLQRELIDRLKAKMAEHGANQIHVARASGFSVKHVNRVLQGRNFGTLDTWQRLLDAVDTIPAGPRVCVLCAREGVSAFTFEAGEFRCSNWMACRERQIHSGRVVNESAASA